MTDRYQVKVDKSESGQVLSITIHDSTGGDFFVSMALLDQAERWCKALNRDEERG